MLALAIITGLNIIFSTGVLVMFSRNFTREREMYVQERASLLNRIQRPEILQTPTQLVMPDRLIPEDDGELNMVGMVFDTQEDDS